MKKLIALLLVTILVFSATSVLAENAEASESRFEQVMLKKGSLIIKEFKDCGIFNKDKYITYNTAADLFAFTEALKLQSASVIDVETGVKVYALRISTGYYLNDYNKGEAIGIMDADEVDGAIQTLKYIKANLHTLDVYSEIVYTASSGMEVGAYHSESGDYLYVRVNSNAVKFYKLNMIDELIRCFEAVSATFNQ